MTQAQHPVLSTAPLWHYSQSLQPIGLAGWICPASPNYLCSCSAVQSLSSCCAFVSVQISQYPSVSYHFSATTEHLNAFVCVVGSYVNMAVTVSSPGREQSLRCKGLDSVTVIRRSGWVPFSELF